MTRVLAIFAAIVALPVAAAPVASASPSKKPPPRGAWTGIHEYGHINNINASGGWDPLRRNGFQGKSQQAAILYNGHAGLGANSKTDGDVAKDIVTDNKDPDKLGAVRTRATGATAGRFTSPIGSRKASATRLSEAQRAGAQVSLLYRDAVKVGADGNGVLAASFATTLSGPKVRYVLLIENGCRPADVRDATKPCPPPVGQLTVTLNGSVVFETDDAFTKARREIALNAIQAADNQLVIAAGGSPRSSARVTVLAVREPARRSAPPRN